MCLSAYICDIYDFGFHDWIDGLEDTLSAYFHGDGNPYSE